MINIKGLIFDQSELTLIESMPMPSFDDVYAFIRDEYLHSRFEGPNDVYAKHYPGLERYSNIIVNGYMRDLEDVGVALISGYESRRGRSIYFNRLLQIINQDAPIEIKKKAPILSRPMAGNW